LVVQKLLRKRTAARVARGENEFRTREEIRASREEAAAAEAAAKWKKGTGFEWKTVAYGLEQHYKQQSSAGEGSLPELKTALVEALRVVEAQLQASSKGSGAASVGGSSYVGGGSVCNLDISLAPKLRHVKVALQTIVGWEFPPKLAAIDAYLELMAARQAWQKCEYSDERIVSSWRKEILAWQVAEVAMGSGKSMMYSAHAPKLDAKRRRGWQLKQEELPSGGFTPKERAERRWEWQRPRYTTAKAAAAGSTRLYCASGGKTFKSKGVFAKTSCKHCHEEKDLHSSTMPIEPKEVAHRRRYWQMSAPASVISPKEAAARRRNWQMESMAGGR
jgi:hypothetical protein